MKRLVKRGLKAVWRWTIPLRRPILSKLEQFLRRCLDPSVRGVPNETDVLMDHVVRELVRLQRQVEALEQAIIGLLPPHETPAIAGEIEPDDADAPDGRLKAG
jgi:hypothetical protein